MRGRLRIYLDTAIFNFVVSTQNVPIEKGITLKLLKQISEGKFMAYISETVLEEIAKAPPQKRDVLLELTQEYPLEILGITEEVEALAEAYLNAKIIPLKSRNDAVHIAMATVHGMDAIVSWNFEHMIKLKTKRGVCTINSSMGYHKTIEICSPLEVAEP